PASSMPGRKARSVRCIDLTLMSDEKSQSSLEHARTVPCSTKPAALSRMSIGPKRFAMAATAELSRTSSRATSDTPPLESAASPFSSISVATTVAPSRAKAIAEARPMPAAPAVTHARLPFRRSPIYLSRVFMKFLLRRPCVRRDDCGDMLVIIPCHADPAGDVVITRRELHARAGGLLADGRAIELLPRRLVGGGGEAAFGLQ